MSDQFDEFLRQDDKVHSVFVETELLEAYVPLRYELYGGIELGDQVKVIGVFDIIANNTTLFGLNIPAMIFMEPTEIDYVTKDGTKYLVLKFNRGDRFIVNTCVIQDPNLAYVLYMETLTLGQLPEFVDYDYLGKLFDEVPGTAGVKLVEDHCIIETVVAQQCRDPNNPQVQYRYTDKKVPPLIIPQRAVPHGAISTTAKIAGAWTRDGLTAAIVHPNEMSSPIEDLFRK